jgi:hypothetical protein
MSTMTVLCWCWIDLKGFLVVVLCKNYIIKVGIGLIEMFLRVFYVLKMIVRVSWVSCDSFPLDALSSVFEDLVAMTC